MVPNVAFSRSLIAALVVLTFLLLISLAWVLTPTTVQGALSINLAGTTNEQGQILFTVKNESRWQLDFWARAEPKTKDGWPPYPLNVPFSSHAMARRLGPKQQMSFYVSPPLWAERWRLWIDYSARTRRETFVLKAKWLLDAFGLQRIAHKLPLDYVGHAIYPDESNNR